MMSLTVPSLIMKWKLVIQISNKFTEFLATVSTSAKAFKFWLFYVNNSLPTDSQ